MRFRKLRIAWSVGWAVVAVLLIVLWLRSYWWADICGVTFAHEQRWNFASENGRIFLIVPDYESAMWAIGKSREWDVRSDPMSIYSTFDEPVFYFKSFSGYFRIIIPHALFALSFATLAAAPWKRWRFSTDFVNRHDASGAGTNRCRGMMCSKLLCTKSLCRRGL
jgi:hypothetical protein